ncbi:MAG TPA: tyrosine-type recombinase/integrase [Flavisolibacter sp.]|nr:tyrosine-type recombinase/integrase [Flavisolibacter sp.]
MQNTQNTFQDIKIHGKHLKHDWFIGFKFYCAQRKKSKHHQVRLGINYYNTIKERLREAENVEALVKQCLKDGWNPFDCQIKDFLVNQAQAAQKPALDDPRSFGLNKALDWAFSKKDLKKRSIPSLVCIKDMAKQAAIDLGIDKMLVREVTRFYVRELLDRMKINRQAFYDAAEDKRYKGKKFTPNNYNRYLAGLSAVFFELEDRDIIENNPCRKIAKKDEIDFGIHRHPTAKEAKMIKDHLKKVHPEFLNCLRFEYVTGMRPDEILDVKFSMVDYLNSCINISDNPYNDEGELISKTTAYRQVPVPGFLLEWLRNQSVGHDSSEYVFSLRFLPGKHRIKYSWISMLWRQLIIDGLGINVSFYSFKGYGGEAKRDAGIEVPAIAAGFGHSSTDMARGVYLKKEGERLRKQLVEMTPDL